MIAAGWRNEKITGVLVAFPITSRIPNRTKNLSWTTVQGDVLHYPEEGMVAGLHSSYRCGEKVNNWVD